MSHRARRSRALMYTGIAILGLAMAGLIYLASVPFSYYDNGRWVKSSLLAVYARSAIGYGAKAIEDRCLPPRWGTLAAYAARNFTLDLVGLDYSLPLSWEEIASGPGLNVMRTLAAGERTPVATYPSGPIEAGKELTVTIRAVKTSPGSVQGGQPGRQSETPVFSLTLYRPRFSSAAYVTKVEEIKPGSVDSGGFSPDGEPLSYNRMFDFALGLFRESFAAGGDSGNLLVSPYSVTEAFAMACAGAEEDTRETMARVLGLTSATPDRIMEQRGNYRAYLASLSPEISVEVANSIWMTDGSGIRFKPDFLRNCRDLLGAEARTVDFRNPDTVRLINDWVGQKTRGKIPSIMDGAPKNQITALVNAVYLKAPWQYPFNPEATKKAPFRTATGDLVECDMMMRGGNLGYLEADGFRAVRLPYAAGQLAMYVFLPDEKPGLPGFVSSVTTAKWRQWMQELQPISAMVHLPRFGFEYGAELKSSLAALGMGIAFDPSKADFSAMCEAPEGTPVYISDVSHKTFISVDEAGTEAAAATKIDVVGAGQPEFKVDITFDRPFAFAIRDERDGSLLFIGCVSRP